MFKREWSQSAAALELARAALIFCLWTMKKEYEAQYHLLEENHWWFLGRRHLVRQLILKSNPNPNCRILEIGCSGGPLIQYLHRDGYTCVTGIDISSEAIALSHQRGLKDVHVMDAQKLSFSEESFDLIIASDVLEHVEHAPRALSEWYRVLRPGGTLIIFVPAFMFLWTKHDEVNRHFRRYRKAELDRLLTGNGFVVKRTSYWNCFLFFPVSVVRLIKKLMPVSRKTASHGDLSEPPTFLNRFLFALLRFENRRIGSGINWPCGVSVMAIAEKPKASRGKPGGTE
ncbi:MAG: class I SAM-dependent methyltransferase [Verrucomicrobiota bacterium]